MASNTNYTEEMTESVIARYNDGVSLEDIANDIGKTVPSVRAKLVREGVYVAPEKSTVKADRGPSKADILAELDAEVDFDATSLKGATKDGLMNVLAHIRR